MLDIGVLAASYCITEYAVMEKGRSRAFGPAHDVVNTLSRLGLSRYHELSSAGTDRSVLPHRHRIVALAARRFHSLAGPSCLFLRVQVVVRRFCCSNGWPGVSIVVTKCTSFVIPRRHTHGTDSGRVGTGLPADEPKPWARPSLESREVS